jgi:hypothetical protein
VWLILIIFFLALSWLLFTPLELQVDTRVPEVYFRWFSIGKATVTYQNEKWWLNVRVLFFHKQWDLQRLILTGKKKKKIGRRRQKQATSGAGKLRKFLNVFRSFQLIKWKTAIDTGNAIDNAYLYPLNFLPHIRKHCHINFGGENYLVFKIRNTAWKLAYAFLK